jgi:hypothetical protein
MSEWIEFHVHDENANAPEMNQEILCFRKSDFKMFYIVAEYMGFNKEAQHPFHVFFVEDGEMGWTFDATHWKNLPEPPGEHN